jgi:hypothetical protein
MAHKAARCGSFAECVAYEMPSVVEKFLETPA